MDIVKSYNYSYYPYTVKFDKGRYHQVRDMIEWCCQNIGEGFRGGEVDLWLVSTVFGNSIFKFREQKHAMWFSLRWS